MNSIITPYNQDLIRNLNIRLLNYCKELALTADEKLSNYEKHLKRSMSKFMKFLVKFKDKNVAHLANSTACLFELKLGGNTEALYALDNTKASEVIRGYATFVNAFSYALVNYKNLDNENLSIFNTRTNGNAVKNYLSLTFGSELISRFRDQLKVGSFKIDSLDGVMLVPRFNGRVLEMHEDFSFLIKQQLLISVLSSNRKKEDIIHE